LGLLTKSDFVDAYQKELSLETPVKDIMSQVLACLNENTNKDDAAKFFENEHKHHAVVINNDGDFVGLISAWDIAAETAEDARAFPWNRSEDAKFHRPDEKVTFHRPDEKETTPGSPTSVKRDSHTFLDYIDSIRETPFMDD